MGRSNDAIGVVGKNQLYLLFFDTINFCGVFLYFFYFFSISHDGKSVLFRENYKSSVYEAI